MPTVRPDACLRCGACIQACSMGVLAPGPDGLPAPNPRRECILCTHCAAVCPAEAVEFAEFERDTLYAPPPEDPVLRALSSRRSIRRFRQELPDEGLLRRVLDLAQSAPSGHNYQTRGWMVLLGRRLVDAAALALLDSVRRQDSDPQLAKRTPEGILSIVRGAPCLLLCHDDPDNINAPEDSVLALGAAELALTTLGLGVCWSGHITHHAQKDPLFRQALGIPPGRMLYGVLMVGLPQGPAYLRPAARLPAEISWRRE